MPYSVMRLLALSLKIIVPAASRVNTCQCSSSAWAGGMTRARTEDALSRRQVIASSMRGGIAGTEGPAGQPSIDTVDPGGILNLKSMCRVIARVYRRKAVTR